MTQWVAETSNASPLGSEGIRDLRGSRLAGCECVRVARRSPNRSARNEAFISHSWSPLLMAAHRGPGTRDSRAQGPPIELGHQKAPSSTHDQ